MKIFIILTIIASVSFLCVMWWLWKEYFRLRERERLFQLPREYKEQEVSKGFWLIDPGNQRLEIMRLDDIAAAAYCAIKDIKKACEDEAQTSEDVRLLCKRIANAFLEPDKIKQST